MPSSEQVNPVNANEILSYVEVVSTMVGENWLNKTKKKESEFRQEAQRLASKGKINYIYRPEPHPLIAWFLEFEEWLDACRKSGRMEANIAVLRLTTLGRCLNQTRHLPGFTKLVNRLKHKDSFYSAAFEVEIADSYCNNGHKVTFIDESTNSRTPDLRVQKPDGSHFWVECKCRDKSTQRDQTNNSIWEELEQSIFKVIGRNKHNAAFIIRSKSDPTRDEIAELRDFLLKSLASGGIGKYDINTGAFDLAQGPTEKYLVAVQPLAVTDDEIKIDGIKLQSKLFDRYLVAFEFRAEGNQPANYRNPTIFGYINDHPSDVVKNIIHGFSSAVGQLPKEGPGIIWIRIPDNSWDDDFDTNVRKAETLLQSELTDDMNRRVNEIFLMTRVARAIHNGSQIGFSYTPITLSVRHPNPRHKVT